ncbi:hypothetical protein WJX84_005189 [Apatococcus fuscideae]|uniref:non-specific serine/threonine protein kinase n=1 Tax=Apatococcus fuscideae TaxID=2026836 RepID=A0AAW1SQB2_9CHLO
MGTHDIPEEDEEQVAETDPRGRWSRYRPEVGTGRFKHVYRGFDHKHGIDVAWSKIKQAANHLTPEQMVDIRREMGLSLDLDHANIIKCFACWLEPDPETFPGHPADACLNFVTEYFTSGNLRDYRQRHKQKDVPSIHIAHVSMMPQQVKS